MSETTVSCPSFPFSSGRRRICVTISRGWSNSEGGYLFLLVGMPRPNFCNCRSVYLFETICFRDTLHDASPIARAIAATVENLKRGKRTSCRKAVRVLLLCSGTGGQLFYFTLNVPSCYSNFTRGTHCHDRDEMNCNAPGTKFALSVPKIRPTPNSDAGSRHVATVPDPAGRDILATRICRR